MSILIEDSPRNLAKWIIEADEANLVTGAVISPFVTPWPRHSRAGLKAFARAHSEKLHNAGVEVWFDATTHALQMHGTGDFRFYEDYDLWDSHRGDLATVGARSEHIGRVFAIQDELGARHLAPTLLVHSGLSEASQRALDMAKEATAEDANCWITIAGTSPFWQSRAALDAHIGALSQLNPGGWFLVVVRTDTEIPVDPNVEEVHGLCRTSRALSEDTPVHISHGDLAALPALAAGASTVGSGWDKRQRVFSYTDYAARPPASDGGSWYARRTLWRLIGSLSINEAEILANRDSARVTSLGGLPPPAVKEVFFHHLSALNLIADAIQHAISHEGRYHELEDRYLDATAEWVDVQRITNCEFNAQHWIDPLRKGLELYGTTEGWVP